MAIETESAAAGQPERTLLGHPPGLFVLFFTEMWERFSYYGMRAILMLFMTASIATGGLGMEPAQAGPIYAMYTSLVYLVAIPGGWIADNFLGQRRSVLFGGIVIMFGHICLALHGMAFFYTGLGLVIVGTGLLKPNISAIVGQLYSPKDVRRDSGFSIFYMGINIGALLAPMVCGWLAQNPYFRDTLTDWGMDPKDAWHWGFGAAAVGMFFGLMQYVLTGRALGIAGLQPATPKDHETAAYNRLVLLIGIGAIAVIAAVVAGLAYFWPQVISDENIHKAYAVSIFAIVIAVFAKLFFTGNWTRAERARLTVIFVLFWAAAIFWGVFEQAGSTLTLFADRDTDNRIAFLGIDWPFDSSLWQSANSAFVVILAPFFSWLWIALGKHNPSYPTKFGIGLLFAGLGFLWLIGGASASADGTKVGIQWLTVVYLLHTIGELCLSPVGLSSMTKLAPARVVGMMMGVWFLAASVGNFLGGSVSSYYPNPEEPPPEIFAQYNMTSLMALFFIVGISAIVMALIMFALVIPIKRMMAVGGLTATGEPTS
jgi:POT family proton-dependent oligopeptide transporter